MDDTSVALGKATTEQVLRLYYHRADPIPPSRRLLILGQAKTYIDLKGKLQTQLDLSNQEVLGILSTRWPELLGSRFPTLNRSFTETDNAIKGYWLDIAQYQGFLVQGNILEVWQDLASIVS